ncbi:MAG: sugar transferase [candidate division Zixibacteria bacterium HGW-Zixibacteria-1]|nr:MAG: sugar transferase [candidate division Zixibacteria bacterium HGW-Zixibacteria-1]
MSKTVIETNYESKVSHSYAISQTVVGYGKVITVEPGNVREALRKQSFNTILRYYYGEYITGIMFIFALLLYTLMTPINVANPVKYVIGMIDKLMKKILDVGGAIIGIIVALPIFLVVPLLIKLTSSGPVFYTQERVGINRRRNSRRIYKTDVNENMRIRERRREDSFGRPFKVIKFRTMVTDAEKLSGPVWATQNDARVTPLGRFLRKTRLDEVPQLLNVLKGDMSLVGPRPERPKFVRELREKVPNYDARLRVKPGITGLAQVSQGYDSSIESVVDKVRHDVKYIHKWSIVTDLKILAKTVVVVLTGRGAC